MIPTVKDVTAIQFEVVTEGELASVIDTTTGHPVCVAQPSMLAEIDCAELNAAAASGPKALARALGAIDPE
jgi:hypothetical protein